MALASENGMEREQSSNRRIAKNTLALYVRMFLTMVVGLYTSRVVLATLGVEDYGVYGVVGGITSMLGFLNASMSGATSRFLTFELGRGDKKRLENTFSSAMIVHMGIAAVVLVLAETVGLWFLCHKLVIPPERMTAAHWVYQLSILSSMLTITQVPYNATIIAHENMNVYAYVEILNSVLKLLIVYLLTIGDFDKLILYAVLMLAVSVMVMMTYRIYCVRHYSESHFHWVWDKAFLTPLLSFSGWNIYAAMCFLGRQQGTNFILNFFGGAVLNAAASLAATADGIITGFAYNVVTAFRPQIIKQYAVGDKRNVEFLLGLALKVSLFLFAVFALPLATNAEMIIRLWLGSVPGHTVAFLRIILLSSAFQVINTVFLVVIQATGYIKSNSKITGTISILNLLPLYLLLRFGIGVDIAYYIVISANMLISVANYYCIRKTVPEIVLMPMYLQAIFFIIIECVIAYVLNLTCLSSFKYSNFVIVFFVNLFIALGFMFASANEQQRNAIFNARYKILVPLLKLKQGIESQIFKRNQK